MPVPGSGNTETRPDAVWCFMVSWLRQCRVACAPETAALLETIPFCARKKDKRLSLTRASPDRHLQECLLLEMQSQDPVAFNSCSLRRWFCGMDVSSPFFRHGDMRELKRWNPMPQGD